MREIGRIDFDFWDCDEELFPAGGGGGLEDGGVLGGGLHPNFAGMGLAERAVWVSWHWRIGHSSGAGRGSDSSSAGRERRRPGIGARPAAGALRSRVDWAASF